MPWQWILVGGAVMLLLVAGLWQLRRPRSATGSFPDVGQPPQDAKPMVEPRLQDIGSGTYELPFPDPGEKTDHGPD